MYWVAMIHGRIPVPNGTEPQDEAELRKKFPSQGEGVGWKGNELV